MSAAVARVVRLASLLGGGAGAASDRAIGAARELAEGKIVVAGNLAESQDDGAAGAVVAVHGDAVGRAGDRSKGHTALQISRSDVVVARDRRQGADASTPIDRQQRVKAAAHGIDHDGGVAWSRPEVPDGMAAGVASMVRLAGFLGGVDAGADHTG